MLYTRKGDSGTTKILNCDQRLSKSSAIAEALGSVDEINSLLGWCKVKAETASADVPDFGSTTVIIDRVQHNLFAVQAELAGADKTVAAEAVIWLEQIIDRIEKELPPIKSFLVAGGTELSAMFDHARTVARRAERRVVATNSAGGQTGKNTLAFLNRLSSLLYALARLANKQSGITEEAPRYQ